MSNIITVKYVEQYLEALKLMDNGNCHISISKVVSTSRDTFKYIITIFTRESEIFSCITFNEKLLYGIKHYEVVFYSGNNYYVYNYRSNWFKGDIINIISDFFAWLEDDKGMIVPGELWEFVYG